MNQYEAMFLFDPTFGASFENCEAEVRRLMERAEAELLFCRKWDERRLAFRIQGRKRGVYVLTYFKTDPAKIAGLERDARLAEDILRVLVLRADGVTPEAMERALDLGSVSNGDEGGSYKPREGREGRDRRESRPPREPVGAASGAGSGGSSSSASSGGASAKSESTTSE